MKYSHSEERSHATGIYKGIRLLDNLKCELQSLSAQTSDPKTRTQIMSILTSLNNEINTLLSEFNRTFQ